MQYYTKINKISLTKIYCILPLNFFIIWSTKILFSDFYNIIIIIIISVDPKNDFIKQKIYLNQPRFNIYPTAPQKLSLSGFKVNKNTPESIPMNQISRMSAGKRVTWSDGTCDEKLFRLCLSKVV